MTPPEKRTARQKEYIKTVRELQTVLSDVRTVEDAAKAYDRFFVDNGYLEKVQGWGLGKRNPLPGNEKGSGQSRDHKQIVQYHADSLG